MPPRLILILLAVCALLQGCAGERGQLPPARGGQAQRRAEMPHPWPPRLGEPFPDLELVDQAGNRVALSSFRGEVILVEWVGMSCSACQAFSGAHAVGPFRGGGVQEDLGSIEEYLRLYSSGASLNDVVFVQVLFYGMGGQEAPRAEDAKAWAEHFGFDRERNRVVLAGEPRFVRPETRERIPGFQLIDRDFLLRSDATRSEQLKLYSELLPMIPRLLEEAPST